MRFNYLIKALPFLSTLLLLIFLTISNQKESTKLRILIWNTPSLTLGTYLSISTGTGFILSYILTTSLYKTSQNKPNKSIKYKNETINLESNEYDKKEISSSFEKTLIERDINDPSPTIKASFRVIRKTEGNITNLNSSNVQYDDINEFEDNNYDLYEKNETPNREKAISTDWNDHSYSRW